MTDTQSLITRLRDSAARDCCSQRTEAAEAIETLQAEMLARDRHDDYLVASRDKAVAERDAALARLAELEKQEPEPVCVVGPHWNSGGGFDARDFKSRPVCGTKLYAAAGALPQLTLEGVLLDTALLIKERPEVKAVFLEMWACNQAQELSDEEIADITAEASLGANLAASPLKLLKFTRLIIAAINAKESTK